MEKEFMALFGKDIKENLIVNYADFVKTLSKKSKINKTIWLEKPSTDVPLRPLGLGELTCDNLPLNFYFQKIPKTPKFNLLKDQLAKTIRKYETATNPKNSYELSAFP